MKKEMTSKLDRIQQIGALTLALLAASTVASRAADKNWTGATASYTNAANWTGGIVPGAVDNAINDNGTNNVVQINIGDPDWSVSQIQAGSGAGNGAFLQNGQTLTVGSSIRGFRMGVAAGNTGVYTLNGGAINYTNGSFSVGELGTGILNMNGGSINGTGVIAVNRGTSLNAVTASMDGGPAKSGYTWFEQGFYTTDPARGLPAAGANFTSVSNANYSFTMPPSYAANNVFMLNTNLPGATITLSTPAAFSALSLLGSAGHGPITLNYTVHHADATTETGTIAFQDWFPTNRVNQAFSANGRVLADGTGVQEITDNPCLLAVDIVLANTTSAVNSIDLSFNAGSVDAHSAIFALSGSTGGAFNPVTITGFTQDVVVESGAAILVSGSVTDVLNQTAGDINTTGELWVGNGGVGIYNFTNGTINASNWINIGRFGGTGTFNMAGGTINKSGSAFSIGANADNLTLGTVGTVNQSAGTINSSSEVWIGQANNHPGLGTGTNNISGTAVLNVTNWIAVGREGAIGVLNISGGSVNKFGGGNVTITHGTGAAGTINQTGGSFNVASGEVWIGEDGGTGIWNLNGGTATVGVVHVAQTGSATGLLNVNGGTLTATELTTGNILGISTLNLNGGVIRPAGNSVNFLHDIIIVGVQSGGAIFDSQGFNITIPQTMPNNGGDATGGLTKNGLGTLTLSGVNSYAGPTVVNAGMLATTTASTGGGDYGVADSAALGVQLQAANAQLNIANLTVGTTTGASLNFDLGNFGNPGASFAPLNASSVLAANGTITVNVVDALPQLGQFPLIKYGSLTGSGTFTLGSVPTGVTASLSNNVANNSIDLVIIGVNLPRWEGLAGGDWDIGVTTNWVNLGTGLPTFYTEGSFDLFDDSALGTTTVNLTTTLHPGRVTVTNDVLPYTFSGPGKISGSIGLTKQGTSSLTIVNTGGNDFTGPVTISGGTLSVTNLANGGSPSPIGASSANQTNLVFAGGALSYAGPPVSINRGYTVTAGGSSIETVSNLTLSGVVRGPSATTFNKTGLGQLTYTAVTASNLLADPAVAGGTYLIKAGTVLLDGSAGPQTNYSRNLNVGSDAGVDPTLILTNTTLFTRLTLGNNANCTGTMILNSNTFLKVLGGGGNFVVGGQSSGAGSPTAGVFIQNPGTTVDADAELWVAQGPAATGTYNMNGGTAIFRSWVAIGRNGGNATFNMTGGTVTRTTDNGGNRFMIGSRDGTTGTSGTLNQSGGTLLCFNEYWIGEAQNNAGAAFGTNNISGTATLIVSNWIAIGREGAIGVLNLSGGSVTKLNGGTHIEIGNGTGSTGTINQTGGAFTNTISETRLGTGAPGIWNMSGGTANLAALVFCLNSSCTNGTLNLNGGVLTATQLRANQTGVANVSTLNFNGGTLGAGNGANTNFLFNLQAANVLAGGARIDSGTNIINVSQALLDGTGGGGLTKLGNGTLRLNGTNTYTGSTLVSTGALGGTGTIAGSVTVGAAGTLAPGASVGTLTIGGNLTLNGNLAIEVNKSLAPSNDLTVVTGTVTNTGTGVVTVTNLGAILISAGDKFTLFNQAVVGGGALTVVGAGVTWTNNLAVDGSITALTSAVSTTPVTLTNSFSGGNLNLSWPADHTGWTLQVQTNLVSVGLSTNWFAWPGSSATNTVSIPVNPASPTVFFRLIYP